MEDYEQVPVIGGPMHGQTLAWSTARYLNVPDSRDTVTVVRDGEAVTLFGQHTYELKCYTQVPLKYPSSALLSEHDVNHRVPLRGLSNPE